MAAGLTRDIKLQAPKSKGHFSMQYRYPDAPSLTIFVIIFT